MKLSNEIWPDNPYREMWIVGVSQNSWGQKPLEWCVDRSAEYGYSGIDLFYDRLLDFEPAEYDRLSATFGDYVREKGMEIASIGAHHLTIHPRKWQQAGQMEMMKKAIDFAADAKARTVVAYIGGYYNPPTYKLMSRKDATRLMVESIQECADYCGERGLTFSIEPHQETLINTVDATLDIIDQVDRENLRVTIDFGGMELGMRPFTPVREAFASFKGLLNHVHAKDITGVIGHWNMCWFGGGLVDFKEYAASLRAMDYDGYVCVEWEGWFKGGLEGVGDMSEPGLADMDRASLEAYEFLSPIFED